MCVLQLAINAEQRLEIERLKRELDQRRLEVSHANSALQNKDMVGTFPSPPQALATPDSGFNLAACSWLSYLRVPNPNPNTIYLSFFGAICTINPALPQAGSQMSGALAGLQGEREALLRSVREQEAELSSLRQQSLLQQSSLEQERDRSRRELGAMHAQLQQQVCVCVCGCPWVMIVYIRVCVLVRFCLYLCVSLCVSVCVSLLHLHLVI